MSELILGLTMFAVGFFVGDWFSSWKELRALRKRLESTLESIEDNDQ